MNQKGSRFPIYGLEGTLGMPSGKDARGTTWRPIEAATTSWVPNLKLPATKLSKNNITPRITLQAIPGPTFTKRLPAESSPSANLRIPMSLLIGAHPPKHYPELGRPRSSCSLVQAVSYSRDSADPVIIPFRLTYTVVVNPKSSHFLKSNCAAKFSRIIPCPA